MQASENKNTEERKKIKWKFVFICLNTGDADLTSVMREF